MTKQLLIPVFFLFSLSASHAQTCSFDAQITTADSVLCSGDSTTLSFNMAISSPADTVLPTPIVNNNGQDGNMFNIVATNTIRVTYFEGNIANTPNLTTEYYIYYKSGTHVGFESNSAAWTLIAGPVTITPNAPNTLTIIPISVNIIIPAGQTYAFYLTNTSAATNNNRYHNGTATGNTLATNPDLTILEGTGGAYPFGTFFNARPWEGIVHYDFPPATYLWNTGATTSSITVAPGSTTNYSCVGTAGCTVEDTITVQVNNTPVVDLGPNSTTCGYAILDAGNAGMNYLWNDNSTSQTIIGLTSGTFYVEVTDPVSLCSAGDTIEVTINPLPVVDLGPDITQCDGSVLLDAGNPGAQYLWSDFSGNQTLQVATSGIYSVWVMDTNTCTNSDTVSITINTSPVVTLGSDTALCGGSILLDAGNAGLNYLWSDSSTTQTLPVNTTGSYAVQVSDAVTGCVGSDTVSIVINALPVVALGQDIVQCGDSVTLDAGNSGMNYLWSDNSTGQMLVVFISGNYDVTVTDATTSCSGSDTIMVTINADPAVTLNLPVAICLDDAPLTLTGGAPAGGTYSGPGVTGTMFDPAVGAGAQTITYSYTDPNTGCSGTATTTITVNACTGVSEEDENAIGVFPNPTNGVFTIATTENATVEVFNTIGELVVYQQMNSGTTQMDLSGMENGIYFVRVSTASGSYLEKVVLQK
jgi:hypothetical protein